MLARSGGKRERAMTMLSLGSGEGETAYDSVLNSKKAEIQIFVRQCCIPGTGGKGAKIPGLYGRKIEHGKSYRGKRQGTLYRWGKQRGKREEGNLKLTQKTWGGNRGVGAPSTKSVERHWG